MEPSSRATASEDVRRQVEVESQCLTRPPRDPEARAYRAPPTRESLLSRLRDLGADQSWSEFYRLYQNLIYTTARRYGLDDGRAREVVQDTFLSLTRLLPRFQYDRTKGSFRAWLKRLTYWTVLKQTHPGRMVVSANIDEPLQSQECPEFENIWTEEWKRTLLETAMARLKTRTSPSLIQAYESCVMQNRGHVQTAKLLKRTPLAIRLAVFKVNRLLKSEIARLQKEGF
jgi:RNA polymerase sigma factor (sigma-70 family)